MYYVFAAQAQADVRSAQEALARNCTSETQFWWARQEAADNSHWLMLVDDSDYRGLTQVEIAALLTAAQATSAGYLAASPPQPPG